MENIREQIIKDLMERLFKVRTNKEYQALLEEIENIRNSKFVNVEKYQHDKISELQECVKNIIKVFQWFKTTKMEIKWRNKTLKIYKAGEILRIDIKEI